MESLLEVRGLKTHFATDRGLFRAVDGISFSVPRGRTVGLVGESGCGKSVTSLSVMGLVPSPPGRVEADALMFGGTDVLALPPEDRRKLRGGKMSMIFQEPMTSLNPLHTIEKQLAESLALHQGLAGEAARARIVELLEKVGIDNPASRLGAYPHQLSGGQRQRVMIARALMMNPKVLLADEATSMLDASLRVSVLNVLQELRDNLHLTVLFITHDIGQACYLADEVVVMEHGLVVEHGTTDEVIFTPQHDYTKRLLADVPDLKGSLKTRSWEPGAPAHVPPPEKDA